MLYEKLAILIETHQIAIAREIAQVGIDANLPAYVGLSLETLTNMIVPTIGVIVRYAKTGDPDEYRDYNIRIIERRMTEGRDITDVLTLTYVMFDNIKALVAREFSDVADSSERDRFLRRLDSMRTFSTITVNATRLRYKHPSE